MKDLIKYISCSQLAAIFTYMPVKVLCLILNESFGLEWLFALMVIMLFCILFIMYVFAPAMDCVMKYFEN